ncbi:MAG: helix-turn-helix domain-containing protein [Thermodesulfobacteriota bacterium]
MIWQVEAATIPIFFAAGLALLMAVEHITRKRPNKANLLFFLTFLCCYIIIQGAGFVANSVPPRHPMSIYLFFTAICLVGPTYYFYFNLLLYPDKKYGAASKAHLVVPLIAFCIETGFQCMPSAYKKEWLTAMFAAPPQNILILLVIMGAANAFAYLAYLLRMDLGMVWNVREVKSELRLIVIIDVLAILAVVTLFIGFTFKLHNLFIAGGNTLAVLTIAVFLGYNRYPHFLQMLKTEIDKKRYEKSSLNGVDTDLINDRLMKLFTSEKVYTETELSLKGLSDRLSITPHQLSEYLNDHLKADFRTFINSFRVEEAKKLLTEKPEKSVLEICFDVGFGSKSSFNSVFKKATGQTPSEFRAAITGRTQ